MYYPVLREIIWTKTVSSGQEEAMLTLAYINFALQGRHFINEDKRRILDLEKANKTDIVFCLNSLNTSANECNHFWRLPYSTFKSG